MKAFGVGLNAGFKESASWALKAATDLKRATIGAVGGAASTQELDDIDFHLENGPEQHLVSRIRSAGHLDAASRMEHVCFRHNLVCMCDSIASAQVIEICSATGLPTQTSFVALSIADSTGLLRGRRVVTLPRTYTADPVWYRRAFAKQKLQKFSPLGPCRPLGGPRLKRFRAPPPLTAQPERPRSRGQTWGPLAC